MEERLPQYTVLSTGIITDKVEGNNDEDCVSNSGDSISNTLG